MINEAPTTTKSNKRRLILDNKSPQEEDKERHYILNTPNGVSVTLALSAALRLRARTFLVSAGSMTPSSHNLNKRNKPKT